MKEQTMCDFSEWVAWALEARQWPAQIQRMHLRIERDWIAHRWTDTEANFLLCCLGV
jgi:hypothetical protein